MNVFHLFTLSISILVFIGLFTYSAMTFYSGKNTLFPPDMAPCPDGWKYQSDGTCKIPAPGKNSNLGYLEETGVPIYVYQNISDEPNYSYLSTYYDPTNYMTYKGQKNVHLPLGYFSGDIPYGYDTNHPEKGTINFSDPGWSSYGDPYCAIRNWAKTQNIQWDGMISYNNGCDVTS